MRRAVAASASTSSHRGGFDKLSGSGKLSHRHWHRRGYGYCRVRLPGSAGRVGMHRVQPRAACRYGGLHGRWCRRLPGPGLPCCAHPLSCCAQSQHPEMPVERSEPGVAGFRDYARNDKVEDPTLYGEHRDITLRTSSCHAVHTPSHVAHTPVMLRAVAASRNARRTLRARGRWIPRLRAE